MAGARRCEGRASIQRRLKHKVPRLEHKVPLSSQYLTRNIAASVAFMRQGLRISAMVAEHQKLEAAARIAMGDFEGPDTTAAKPRSRFPYPAYALLALSIALGLAIALL